MDKTDELLQRITRDISDGLILIDLTGRIDFINPNAEKLLNNPALKKGIRYADFMEADATSENDEFHQFVLDCVYDKQKTHSGTIEYKDPDGTIRYFRMTSSYLFSEDGKEKYGLILQFSDDTKLYKMQQKYNDAVKILIGLTAVVCLWNIIYALWFLLDEPISTSLMTVFIEIIGAVGTLFALKYTSLTLQDFGLGKGPNLKNAILTDSLITAGLLGVIIIAKLIILPDEALFEFNNWGIEQTLYPLTVVAQELLTRGAAQGSLSLALPEKTPAIIPIIISSLFFGALHIHKGLVYMIGAMILLSIFGLLYNKQKTICGLCIPHYFLGLSIAIIWGIG